VLARRAEREPEREVLLDPAEQRAEFAQIQRNYYAYHEDPHDAGFSVVSAPIFDHAERLEAALTIVMNRRPGSVNQETRYLKQLKESAVEISRALGSVEMADKMAATVQA
jgi:DNA-binding IclR family transcriptional regulator